MSDILANPELKEFSYIVPQGSILFRIKYKENKNAPFGFFSYWKDGKDFNTKLTECHRAFQGKFRPGNEPEYEFWKIENDISLLKIPYGVIFGESANDKDVKLANILIQKINETNLNNVTKSCLIHSIEILVSQQTNVAHNCTDPKLSDPYKRLSFNNDLILILAIGELGLKGFVRFVDINEPHCYDEIAVVRPVMENKTYMKKLTTKELSDVLPQEVIEKIETANRTEIPMTGGSILYRQFNIIKRSNY